MLWKTTLASDFGTVCHHSFLGRTYSLSVVNKIVHVGTASGFGVVYPQTFSHTVMCKVCLLASNTVFGADAVVRQDYYTAISFYQFFFFIIDKVMAT